MSAIIQCHDIMSYSKESITAEENMSVPQLTASSSAQDPVQNLFFRTSDEGKSLFLQSAQTRTQNHQSAAYNMTKHNNCQQEVSDSSKRFSFLMTNVILGNNHQTSSWHSFWKLTSRQPRLWGKQNHCKLQGILMASRIFHLETRAGSRLLLRLCMSLPPCAHRTHSGTFC